MIIDAKIENDSNLMPDEDGKRDENRDKRMFRAKQVYLKELHKVFNSSDVVQVLDVRDPEGMTPHASEDHF